MKQRGKGGEGGSWAASSSLPLSGSREAHMARHKNNGGVPEGRNLKIQ